MSQMDKERRAKKRQKTEGGRFVQGHNLRSNVIVALGVGSLG